MEAQGQPRCTPLPDCRFRLGTGYKTRAVNGSWGSSSIVTGAVRVVLSQDQLNLAAHNSPRIQGGTTSDPVLDAA